VLVDYPEHPAARPGTGIKEGDTWLRGCCRRAIPVALGGHVARCEDCAHTVIAYNSCLNRHCPKCQGFAAKAAALDG
jgi:hypothetical protein